MAELAVRLLGSVGELAHNVTAGSMGRWNCDAVQGICVARGDADGSGWLRERPSSAPAYMPASAHPQEAAPGARMTSVNEFVDHTGAGPARLPSGAATLPRGPGTLPAGPPGTPPGLPLIAAAEMLEAGTGTAERKGSEMAMPKTLCRCSV